MTQISNPANIHAPLGLYHHCARIDAGAEWLCMAGQIGIAPDGSVEQGFRAQAERAFQNVLAGLQANGFGPEHIVKLTIYIVNQSDIDAMREARASVLGTDAKPPSTLLVVAGLASPEFLIEVDATAAKA